ncbi:SCO family protein [Nocardioides acrostichi]|uniref:SCO family protein n=1 Tax=Nocardioides acrostichi TaxID=2784339 RepID=A0A930UVZ9_9ACTN|nr:SCO family protein [Nocardioides acrostichi]MBF4160662.1 SCO family protein [Nocardioides acrostichi]
MADRLGPTRALVAVLALVLAALAGCSSDAAPAGTFTGSRVDPPFDVADVTLTDTEGQPFSLTDPGQRLSLVFFGYTHCPDVCPLVMSTISSALTRLDDADRAQVQLVFVSTDPTRDDADTLRNYLRGYDPTGVGLRGSLGDVATLAKSVGIFVADAQQLASGGYDLGSHGSQIIGVDGDGRAPVFWDGQVSSAELAADVHTLLAAS